MKSPLPHGIALIIVAASLVANSKAVGTDYRTDINPALRYYQAYLQAPRFHDDDRKYLLDTDWRGRPLDSRFEDLIGRYNSQFRFLRAARRADVPTDWGIDLTDGPAAELPSLAPAKACAVAAKLRTRWHLENGRPKEAAEEYLAVLTQARRVSQDQLLISCLVQIAMENILCSAIAEEFHRWPSEALKEISEGLRASPPRGQIAACVGSERQAFYGWFVRQIEKIEQEETGNEAAALKRFAALVGQMTTDSGLYPGLQERVETAGGGTFEGVVRLVRNLGPIYDEVEALMAMPQGKYEAATESFLSKVEASGNPFAQDFFPAVVKCRAREFATEARLAMVKAAIQFRLEGEAGLRSIEDPFGRGPFAYRRFLLDGKDRGFELRSAYEGREHREVMIFVETEGRPIQVSGYRAGEPIGTTESKD